MTLKEFIHELKDFPHMSSDILIHVEGSDEMHTPLIIEYDAKLDAVIIEVPKA